MNYIFTYLRFTYLRFTYLRLTYFYPTCLECDNG